MKRQCTTQPLVMTMKCRQRVIQKRSHNRFEGTTILKTNTNWQTTEIAFEIIFDLPIGSFQLTTLSLRQTQTDRPPKLVTRNCDGKQADTHEHQEWTPAHNLFRNSLSTQDAIRTCFQGFLLTLSHQIYIPAKLLDYFLWIKKSNSNQSDCALSDLALGRLFVQSRWWVFREFQPKSQVVCGSVAGLIFLVHSRIEQFLTLPYGFPTEFCYIFKTRAQIHLQGFT